MRALIYATHSTELALASKTGVTEVILAPKLLSRRGTLTMGEARALATQALERGLTPALEWDALMTETHFQTITRALEGGLFAPVVRVRDAGAAFWLKANFPAVRLHLLLEAGHHNLPAVQSWPVRLGSQLTRVCLSPELPATVISQWRQVLSVELEVLGLGPLLLFHSGRPLLSSLESAPEGEDLMAEGASEESPHKGFLLQENQHGTLMFHPKDLGLLERWSDLAAAGVDVVRIDHRQQSASVMPILETFLLDPTPEQARSLKDVWDREWMRGYFDVNKSDVLFHKLKNAHLRQQDGVTAGVVLEGKRDGWLAVVGKGAGLKVGQAITALDPKGGARPQQIFWIKNSAFQPVQTLAAGEVGFISWFGNAPTQTVLLAT